jgi:hypothetical protein
MSSLQEREGLTGDALRARVASELKSGALSLSSSGSPYFDRGDALDPCTGCVDLALGLGVAPTIFAAGRPPWQGRRNGDVHTRQRHWALAWLNRRFPTA